MQVLQLDNGEQDAPPCLHRSIPRIIEALGRPEFSRSLFDIARRFAGIECLSAYVSTPAGAKGLLNEFVEPTDLSQLTADRYISRYWNLDPANQIRLPDNRSEASWALRLRPNDISSAAYRSECYHSLGLSERFSLVQTRQKGTLRVNFYLGRKQPFEDIIIEKLTECAPLLTSMLWRHYEETEAVDGSNIAGTFRERLKKVAPTLSNRELDVCSLVATGVTSEGIALELGVGINSVLTYRKRAYMRLRISSQNELMRILM